ncbi:hypothetical protein KR038_011041 [Drosophila bunnanda]|nr:hypothetical protein KR038_011041 [Drosophila bunnanda]
MPRRRPPKKPVGSKGPGTISQSKKPEVTPSSSAATNNPAQALPQFNVEKITGKRFVNGKIEMLVQWEGLPPERNTWELLENLGNSIRMVAQFESTLFCRMGMKNETSDSSSKDGSSKKKGGTNPTPSTAFPATAPGECQLKTAKPVKETSTPNPNAVLNIGGNQKNKIPTKLLHLSDDETPSLSFDKWENLTPADPEITYRPSSPSQYSDSDCQPLSKLRTAMATKKNKNKPQKKKIEENSILTATENPIEESANDISNMHPANMRPEVPTVAQDSKKAKKGSKKIQKQESNDEVQTLVQFSKTNMKSSKKVQKEESSDDDSDIPSMTPCQTVFGLARGLELDKVVHSIRVFDRHFLFVTWKGLDTVDMVPMEDLKETYPAQVLQYFQQMERRYN